MRKSVTVIFAALLVLLSFSAFAEGDAELMATVSRPTIRTNDVIKGVEIAISSSTSSARIFYTLDGSTPTYNSEPYDDDDRPILDEAGEYTIKAIAYNSTLSSRSSVTTQTETVQSVSEALGASYEFSGRITRYPEGSTDPEYAIITVNNVDSPYECYYMYGNSNELDPDDTVNTFRYTEPIRVYKTSQVHFRIYRMGYAPGNKVYTLNVNVWGDKQTVEKPQLGKDSVYGGAYLTLTTDTEGATIRYKSASSIITEELTPSNTSVYTDRVAITRPGTYYFKAYATKDGYFDSDQTSGDHYFVVDQCEKPTITRTASGSFNRITITAPEDDVKIFYTIDGGDPSTKDNEYTSSFTVGADATIKAMAARPGSVSSEVALMVLGDGSDITVEPPSLSATTAGNGTKTVTITAEEGAEIYYCYFTTRPESLVSSDFQLYTEPIVFSETGTYYLYTRAYKDGAYSEVSGATVVVEINETVAAPRLSAESLENGAKVVSIASDEGTEVYYLVSDERVTDINAIPRDKEHLYTYPITFAETGYLSALAVMETSDGEVTSQLVSASVSVPGGPVTLDKVGDVTVDETATGSGVRVTLSCADSDADLFYVFDSSADTAATTADTEYTGAFELTSDGYLHIVAAKPGYEYTYETVEISVSRTADPEITLVQSGSSFIVRFDSDTPNALFYYTTDGTEPSIDDNHLADGGVAIVPDGTTLKVIAVADGLAPSNTVTQIITSGDPDTCSDVIIEISDILGGKRATLVSATYGTTIYYTLDGSEPTTSSYVYDESSPLTFTDETDLTIRAKAVRSGYYDSDVTEAQVTVTRLSAPRFHEAPTQSADGRNIYTYMLTCDEEFAYIYYTMDGTIPVLGAEGTQLYLGTFNIEEDCKLSAIAVAEGYANSTVNERTVVLPENDDTTVAPPVIAVRTDDIIGGKMVELSCITEGASIYYSMTGTTPDTLYTEPIFISGKQATIRAMAVKEGMTDSTVMTFRVANYTSEAPTATIPTNQAVEAGTTVELVGGTYLVPVLDSDGSEIGTETKDYVVFYTLDGSEPTLDSPVYTEPIVIDGETHIRAASAGEEHCLSPIADFYYTVIGESYNISIDTSGLTRESGAVYGSIDVDISGVEAENSRVYAAMYSGGEMVAVKSADFAESLTFDGFEVITDGSVVIKVFVMEDGSLRPLCENSVAVF